MKRAICTIVVMGAALILVTGCATAIYPGGPTPAGSIITSVRSPAQKLAVALDPEAKPLKKGVSRSVAILGLFAGGDASVDAAMKDGGITRVHHVDHAVKSFLFGIYLGDATIVYGE